MIRQKLSSWLAQASQFVDRQARAKRLGLDDQLSLNQLKALSRDALPEWVQTCPVSMHYLGLLGDLPWHEFPHRRGSRGPAPVNRAAYVAAFLIKVDQGYKYMSQLRSYLTQHPALVWLLGFPLVESEKHRYGFDVEQSLACQRQFSRVLKDLDRRQLGFMLEASVKLKEALPQNLAFGETVSLDTKHILAWVKENNPKAYVAERYDKSKQPKGDTECKLGCKKKQSDRRFANAEACHTKQTGDARESATQKQILLGLCQWGRRYQSARVG